MMLHINQSMLASWYVRIPELAGYRANGYVLGVLASKNSLVSDFPRCDI